MKTRHRLLLFVCLMGGLLLMISAQERGFQRQPPVPTKAFIVGGVRHGATFFPKSNYPETKPLKEGELDFMHYHTYDEVNFFLKKWASAYPNLVDLYSVGKSYEGREIWQMTITNKMTGRDVDKPAMFIEGNRHSGEVTAAESALWFAWHVLSNYGKDPALTAMVDNTALYVKIKNNPDGSELYLNTAQSNRSTTHPYDDDGDGLLDEDPAGRPRRRRLHPPGARRRSRWARATPSSTRPTSRAGSCSASARARATISSSAKASTTTATAGRTRTASAASTSTGTTWRTGGPMPGLDLTGRGWTQGGAGEYPLSEVETRYVVLFLLQHPNVSIGQTMDTTVPMLLHGPSTSQDGRVDVPRGSQDLQVFRHRREEDHRL